MGTQLDLATVTVGPSPSGVVPNLSWILELAVGLLVPQTFAPWVSCTPRAAWVAGLGAPSPRSGVLVPPESRPAARGGAEQPAGAAPGLARSSAPPSGIGSSWPRNCRQSRPRPQRGRDRHRSTQGLRPPVHEWVSRPPATLAAWDYLDRKSGIAQPLGYGGGR
jgi:hypothetical protein